MRENVWVDEGRAIKQLIVMMVELRRKGQSFEPITIAAVKGFRKLLGIESNETKEKKVYWRYPDSLRANLQRAGIDPETGVCVDEEAFRIAMKGLEQEEAARLEEKFAGQDYQVRKEALRGVLQRWRPTKAPAVASVGHYLENQVLNSRIAQELREAERKD